MATKMCRARVLLPKVLLLLLFLTRHLHKIYAREDFAQSTSNGSSMIYNIGVVLDMGSWVGKNVHSCITMAISDFYVSNHHYKTRLVLHTRDSRGDPGLAISSGHDLMENKKVQAMIAGPETAQEARSLAALGNEAKVPVFSFLSIQSSPGEYPFLVQICQDEILQFKGIASIVSWYKWKTVSVIYENTDDGKVSIQYMVGSFQERNIRVIYRTAISSFSTNDQIMDELHKLAIARQTIFIVHMSPLLTSRLFLTAERLGMMKEGYAWIVTDKTLNQLQSMADWEVFKSMQGVVGLKAYIPSSRKLRELSLRWKMNFYNKNPSVESGELDVLGIWAYDIIWAMAESIEATGNSGGVTKLLDEISRTRFAGLSGEFQILNGRLHSEEFAIVNIIGKSERRVGFWTPEDGMVKQIHHYSVKGTSLPTSAAQSAGLDKAIIWPGVTTIAPKGQPMLTGGKKLRIAVPLNQGFKEFVTLNRDNLGIATTFKGFSVDVFQAAIESLHYPVLFEFIPFWEKNGSYTDLVHHVYHQIYDGIVGDLTITANRSLLLDFTVPYTDLGTGTITKCQSMNDIWLFLKPLHLDLWLTSAAFVVLTGFVVWFIERSCSNQEFGGSVAHQIGTMLCFGFSTLFYAHRERLTSNLSRLVVIVWLFIVLILTSSYTATLSSWLTLQKIGFAAGDDIGIRYNTFLEGIVANNLNFKDSRLRVYNSPEEYAEGLSKGTKEGGVGAIIDEIPYLQIFLEMYGAQFAMVASKSDTSGFGFAFQKEYAPLVSDLSQAITQLREEGKLAMMQKTWFKSETLVVPQGSVATPNILNLRSFGGLFLINFLCCAFALLICLNSILLNKFNYYNNIIMVLRDGGILAYMLRKIAPRAGQQVQVN